MNHVEKEQQHLLIQLTDKIAQLQDILDDYVTLSSTNYDDNDDDDTVSELTNILQLTYNDFKNLHDLILDNLNNFYDDLVIDNFNSLSRKYSNLFENLSNYFNSNNNNNVTKLFNYKLPNDFIIPKPIKSNMYFDDPPSISESSKSDSNNNNTHTNKFVRFKQDLIESSPDKLFKPYKDNIDEDLDLDDNPKIDLSNKQIFIHNQQQFPHQDNQLNQLHNSIKQQREISIHINRETNDQSMLLNDLESGIDFSNNRLVNSTNKLKKYREALKKRGDWMCILILTFILLFLLLII